MTNTVARVGTRLKPVVVPSFDEEQLEMFEGEPHFLHSDTCPSYCDYACGDGRGVERAEAIKTIRAGLPDILPICAAKRVGYCGCRTQDGLCRTSTQVAPGRVAHFVRPPSGGSAKCGWRVNDRPNAGGQNER